MLLLTLGPTAEALIQGRKLLLVRGVVAAGAGGKLRLLLLL
jgi:hypothetical protein